MVASALQAGVGALLAVAPGSEGSVGPFLRLAPPLIGGLLLSRWVAGRDLFRRLMGGAVIGGLSTLAGTLVALPLRGFQRGVAVVIVSAVGAGVGMGLIGGGLGALAARR